MTEDIVVLRSPDGDEFFGSKCLLVAIDETGHEELADPLYPVFGLGGCLTIVADYHQQLRSPWAAMKRTHFGGPSNPLHATGLRPSADQAAALGNFFRQQTFGRFAAVTTVDTTLGTHLSRFESTALMMGRLIAEAAREYDFDRVAVIFENNERTEPLIRKTFSSTKVYRGEAAKRWQVPTQFFLASKIMAEPLVEVADFVMHASGTAVRSHLQTGVPFLNRRDFAAVFEGGLSRRAAFTRLDSLTPSGATAEPT